MTLLILVILVQNETINQKDSKRGIWFYNKQISWKKAQEENKWWMPYKLDLWRTAGRIWMGQENKLVKSS